MTEHGFDAAIGGARRDEERSRAKERIFSFRDDFGQWDPRAQRPELWNLYNGRIRKGEQVRVFPISNWTELDVWQYVAREQLELPSIYFAHEREVFERDGMLYAASEFIERYADEVPFEEWVRFRTVGDMTLHGWRPLARGDDRGGRRARSPRRGSRSAARRAPTTRSPRQRWRIASGSATSDGTVDAREMLTGEAATAELLRLVTCGSVDDGKSTLIGRLLFDTKQVIVRPARARRGDERAPRRRLRQPRAPHRRSPRRARAGDHHRRRLPLVRHPDPALSARRRARPRPVHAQHGHRRLDRRRRRRPPRRAQGRDRADPPAHASSPGCSGCRTSSSRSTRWISSTSTRRGSARSKSSSRELSERLGISATRRDPDRGAPRGQRRRRLRADAVVGRRRRSSSGSRRSRSPATATCRTAASRCSG